jgi:hypothetical protein
MDLPDHHHPVGSGNTPEAWHPFPLDGAQQTIQEMKLEPGLDLEVDSISVSNHTEKHL